jgi:GxxExxY protein
MASDRDPLTEKVIASAIEVHRHLGPGLLESAYEECLCWELRQAVLKDGIKRMVL